MNAAAATAAARLETLMIRREELHSELRSATLRAFTSEDYYAVAILAKKCAANSDEIEMLSDSL